MATMKTTTNTETETMKKHQGWHNVFCFYCQRPFESGSGKTNQKCPTCKEIDRKQKKHTEELLAKHSAY
jgi:phage FluMu protein Com